MLPRKAISDRYLPPIFVPAIFFTALLFMIPVWTDLNNFGADTSQIIREYADNPYIGYAAALSVLFAAKMKISAANTIGGTEIKIHFDGYNTLFKIIFAFFIA